MCWRLGLLVVVLDALVVWFVAWLVCFLCLGSLCGCWFLMTVWMLAVGGWVYYNLLVALRIG